MNWAVFAPILPYALGILTVLNWRRLKKQFRGEGGEIGLILKLK